MSADDLRARAAQLAGEPVGPLTPVGGGGNNRLFRAAGARRRYAVKVYPDDPDDARERYQREFAGLRFLWTAGERRIPEPLALDAAAGIALYGWLDGARIAAADPPAVAALAAFARALHDRRAAPGAGTLPPAREAVFERGELEAQLARRLTRLAPIADDDPALRALLAEIRRETDRRAGAASAPLRAEQRTLSPSDFGLHNALRTPAGVVFLDFEYFGWDDPVKLVADVVWHPGVPLDAAARRTFFAAAADIYGVDPSFEARFERDAPLYGLRWALIALNELLPDGLRRRIGAGAVADPAAARARQLAKAADFVARVRRGTLLA